MTIKAKFIGGQLDGQTLDLPVPFYALDISEPNGSRRAGLTRYVQEGYEGGVYQYRMTSEPVGERYNIESTPGVDLPVNEVLWPKGKL